MLFSCVLLPAKIENADLNTGRRVKERFHDVMILIDLRENYELCYVYIKYVIIEIRLNV